MQKYRILSFVIAVLYFLMLFPVMPVLASTADRDNGHDDGYGSGYVDGIEAGLQDQGSGNRKNANAAMPKSSEIIEDHGLSGYNNDYRSGFLTGYRSGFKAGYDYGYDNADKEAAVKFDETLGYAMGEYYGRQDYYAGRSNNWGRPLPNTTELIKAFELNKEPQTYKDDFLVNFKLKFKEGYEYGYRYAKLNPYVLSVEQGEKDGEGFGGILGKNRGSADFYSGAVSNSKKDLPSDERIKGMFLLGNDSQYYMDAFIAAFKVSYIEKYEEAYRKAKADRYAALYTEGYNNGWEAGSKKGVSLAAADRMMNLASDENRYRVTENSIIAEFVLNAGNERYKDGFISGYLGGIKEGYVLGYTDYTYMQASKRSASSQVPISGMEVKSGDNRLKLNIQKGTYYNDVIVNIDAYADGNTGTVAPTPPKMIKASSIYTITIANMIGVSDRDKAMKLSFEYYGPENGGIYMYANGSWTYLPSKFEAAAISTQLLPKNAVKSTAIYGVFIDENARSPYDLRGNWAKDEITAYLRRGIIDYPGNNYFMPDAALSYNQAVAWLNKVWGSKLNKPEGKDRAITYTEFEGLFRKAKGDGSFTWGFIADKMAKNKDKRSGSYSSMNKNVTRAEAIYALYYMNE